MPQERPILLMHGESLQCVYRSLTVFVAVSVRERTADLPDHRSVVTHFF